MSEQKLVPVESTSAMDIAGAEVMHGDFNRNDAERVWRAMVSAAPISEQVAPFIERFSIYEDHGRANMMGDDDGEYVLYSHHVEALATMSAGSQEVTQQAAADETTQDMLVGATYALRAIAEGTGSPASTARVALRVIASLSTEGTQQAAKAETAEQALLGEILSLAELGVSYGLLADDYCSQIVAKLKERAPTTSTVSASGALAADDDVWNEAMEAAASLIDPFSEEGTIGWIQANSIRSLKRTAAQAATDKIKE